METSETCSLCGRAVLASEATRVDGAVRCPSCMGGEAGHAEDESLHGRGRAFLLGVVLPFVVAMALMWLGAYAVKALLS